MPSKAAVDFPMSKARFMPLYNRIALMLKAAASFLQVNITLLSLSCHLHPKILANCQVMLWIRVST